MKTKFESVAEYIAAQPKPTQAVLKRVRSILKKALPRAIEGISYQIPVYKIDGRAVVFFAGWTAHFSLYPASPAMSKAFKRELATYRQSKGTIRFPLEEKVPARLIERLARFRAREVVAAVAAKAAAKKPRASSRGRR